MDSIDVSNIENKTKEPKLKPNTPYMLRQDGKLLECGQNHPYIKESFLWDFKSNLSYLINKEAAALDWFKNNTNNKELTNLIDKGIKLGTNMPEDIFNKINDLTNEEFCRVRASNYKYKYGGNNGEVYFRISSKNFNWFDNIWNVILLNSKNNTINYITVMRDHQTFGGKKFEYMNSKKGPINNMSTEDFLSLNKFEDKIIEENLDSLEPKEESKTTSIEEFINDLYKLRQDSIVNEGEYGLGSLVFKEFRNLGYLDNLKDIKNEIEDKELSLEKLQKQTSKNSDNNKVLEEGTWALPDTKEKAEQLLKLLKKKLYKKDLDKLYDIFGDDELSDSILENEDNVPVNDIITEYIGTTIDQYIEDNPNGWTKEGGWKEEWDKDSLKELATYVTKKFIKPSNWVKIFGGELREEDI